MSNVKEVEIRAVVKWFDFVMNDKLNLILGRMTLNPVFGLKVETGIIDEKGNDDKMGIIIRGQEAVSIDGLKNIISLLNSIGKVTVARCRDIENNQTISLGA